MKDSNLNKRLAHALAVVVMLAQTASAVVTIDTVHVGNIGNANDPSTGYGGVNYGYSIGKYEVTTSQYSEFLNAVGAMDTYGIYDTRMATDWRVAGIARSGTPGSYSYSVIGSGNHPVTWITWFSAARFVNWLNNGQPAGAQTGLTTEMGAYTLNGAISGTGISRNSNSTFGLPSENEWYKAAYHQPVEQGGDTDNYWLYPTKSNATPNSRNGSTTDPNSANFFRDDYAANGFNGGYAVSQDYNQFVNMLTDVGAFSAADSFYGTFDQGGSLYEWNDAVVGATRGVRGGSWGSSDYYLTSAGRMIPGLPPPALVNMGFRVVVVPEPSVTALATLGIILFRWRRSRIS
jgi:formylglycine-generating enzyme